MPLATLQWSGAQNTLFRGALRQARGHRPRSKLVGLATAILKHEQSSQRILNIARSIIQADNGIRVHWLVVEMEGHGWRGDVGGRFEYICLVPHKKTLS